jgi:hypothetical protein
MSKTYAARNPTAVDDSSVPVCLALWFFGRRTPEEPLAGLHAFDKTFRDEQSTLIQQPEHVDKKFNELVERLDK